MEILNLVLAYLAMIGGDVIRHVRFFTVKSQEPQPAVTIVLRAVVGFLITVAIVGLSWKLFAALPAFLGTYWIIFRRCYNYAINPLYRLIVAPKYKELQFFLDRSLERSLSPEKAEYARIGFTVVGWIIYALVQ